MTPAVTTDFGLCGRKEYIYLRETFVITHAYDQINVVGSERGRACGNYRITYQECILMAKKKFKAAPLINTSILHNFFKVHGRRNTFPLMHLPKTFVLLRQSVPVNFALRWACSCTFGASTDYAYKLNNNYMPMVH